MYFLKVKTCWQETKKKVDQLGLLSEGQRGCHMSTFYLQSMVAMVILLFSSVYQYDDCMTQNSSLISIHRPSFHKYVTKKS